MAAPGLCRVYRDGDLLTDVENAGVREENRVIVAGSEADIDTFGEKFGE